MTSLLTRKTRNDHSSGLIHGGTAILMPSSQRRIEQDEHDPVQLCSSTIVDNTRNNRKKSSQTMPAFHILSLTAS